MTTRLVFLPAGQEARAMAARVAVLSQAHSVLVVACRKPMRALTQDLAAAGANLAHVFIVDVITDPLAKPAAVDAEHQAFLHGPSLLELIAKRVDQLVKRKAERPAVTVIDDVDSFLDHAGVNELTAIVSHATSLLTRGNSQEYLATGKQRGRPIHGALHGLLDEETDVGPDGVLVSSPRGSGT